MMLASAVSSWKPSHGVQHISPGKHLDYCSGCAHFGHKLKSSACPFKKVNNFLNHKITRYGNGGMSTFGMMQFRSDVKFIFDGFKLAMRDLMKYHKRDRKARRMGAKLMSSLLIRICNLGCLAFRGFGYYKVSSLTLILKVLY